MTHNDAGHYAKKHPSDQKIDERIAAEIKESLEENMLSCEIAERIAGELSVPMGEIGKTADLLEVKISKCQLGMYGYATSAKHGSQIPAVSSVEPALAAAIQDRLVDNRLGCKDAWDIAKQFGLEKPQITGACDFLKIKIKRCQLGAF